jgi:YVTN family beta-propeller protein
MTTKSLIKLPARIAAIVVIVITNGLAPYVYSAETTTTTVPVGWQPKAIAVNVPLSNPDNNKIYVANFSDNSVTVINGNNNSIISTLNGFTSPVAIAVNSTTNRVYVANQCSMGSCSVTVVDGENDTLIGSPIPVGSFPTAIAVNTSTNKIYVANYGSSSVTVINGADNSQTIVSVGLSPIAIALNSKPEINKIYVLNYENTGNDTVTVIDAVTNNVIATVPVGSVGSFDPSPTVMAVNPTNNKVYVANELSDNVTVIDGVSNTHTTLIAPSGQTWDAPRSIAINPITSNVYVANKDSNNVAVIDGGANPPITINAPTGQVWGAPYAIAVNPSINKIYVANRSSDNVTVIDGITNTPSILAAPLEPVYWYNPRAIAVNFENNKVYVANEYSDNVAVIQNLYSLNITKSGTGTGTVTSLPSGISCGTTCNATNAMFAEGEAVVLYEFPSSNSGFVGWGGCTRVDDYCAFSMLSDKSVSADFISEPLVKNQNTGVAYGDLQAAYNEAKVNHVIRARNTLPASGLSLNKATSLNIEGGYDHDYSSCVGVTTIFGLVDVKLARLNVRGLAIKAPSP